MQIDDATRERVERLLDKLPTDGQLDLLDHPAIPGKRYAGVGGFTIEEVRLIRKALAALAAAEAVGAKL